MPFASKYVFAALCVFCRLVTAAQEYPFIKYTPKDGLVSSRLQNFYQDSRGRIFFMTANGLSLYDGARFINYTIDDGLAHPIINDVLEITADSILVATNTSSLNAWVKGVIKTIKTRDGFCPVINKFYRSKGNIIYVVTDEGLFRLDKDIFIPLAIYENDNPLRFLNHMIDVGDYFLLKKFDGSPKSNALVLVNKNTLSATSFLQGMGISCVTTVDDENLVLVIADNQLLSFELDAAGKGFLKQTELPTRYRLLKPFYLIKILVDRNRNVWAVTTNGVVRCSPDGRIQIFDRTNGLTVENIVSIEIDKENILWMLTDGNGVVKLVNKNVEIINGQIGRSPAAINAVYPDDAGNVWMFNSKDKSLYRKNRDGVRKWHLNLPVHAGSIRMRNGAILLFESKNIFEAKPLDNDDRCTLKPIYHTENDNINVLRPEIDKNGNIYLPGKNLITVLTASGQEFNTPLPGFIDWLSFDQQQQIWSVTRTGDLLCFQMQSGSAANRLVLKFQDKLDIDNPRSITVDKEGKIWIGTRYAGLYCLEYKNGKLVSQRHWSKKEGLTDNFILYVACDRNNVIWAGTQSGLDKISYSGNVVESITRSNNIYQPIPLVHVGINNDIWATGAGGVIAIYDEKPENSDYQPKLQIVRMVTGDKVLSLPLNKTVLPPQTRQVTIEVASPSFIDEKRITYSYRLDGNEQGEWSAPTTQASFYLINLQPGEYTLHIKSFFPVARYKTEQLIYHFTILPPWWRTWWFRALLAGAFVMSLVLLTRTYYQRKLQRQKIDFERQTAIEQERTRIAMEMHDDLGSGLTSIRYLATGLTSSESSLVKEKAIKIESSAKQLVDSMNDIIWTMKSDNNWLSETLNYVRKQAAESLESAGMDYKFDFPKQVDEIKLTNDQKRNLILISKEAVHNAIKHSNATSLSITAIRSKENLRLSFSDNGKGFSYTREQAAGNGLMNMQRRATAIDASIEITHEPGTTVSLTMKLI
jgi:signal transduction histidine kinase/ligand-binding sensor domain-containing protein